MRPVEPTHVLFLFIRVLAVALGMQGVLLTRLFFLGSTRLGGIDVEARRVALIGLLELLVAGALFLFPDRLAIRMMRRTPENLTRVAIIVCGLVLAMGAVEQLVSWWPMANLAVEERWLGFIPKDWSIVTYLLRMLAAILVLLFSEHISNWLDPDWRKMWAMNRYPVDDED